MPGVIAAHANFATAQATVSFDPQQIAPHNLVQGIEKAGYRVPAGTAAPARTPELDVLAKRTDSSSRAQLIEAAELAEQRGMKRDFVVAATLTVPALVLAMSHGLIPALLSAHWSRWAQFALVTPVVFGPGRRFLRLAWAALKHRTSDMNTLVSVGVLSAWLYSTVALLTPNLFPHAEHGHRPHVYFEAAGAILMFVLLGKLLESRARKRLSDAVKGLVSLVPKTAHRLRGSVAEDVQQSSLQQGDVVLVRPAERIPVDGIVIAGSSAVDESMLTGESIPVDKHEGVSAFAGTLNQSGALTLRVTNAHGKTALDGIVMAVEQAQGSRAPIARIADTVSSYFVPSVIVVAIITLGVWLAVDFSATGLSVAVERFVAVLVIACPCALGLATPAAVAVGTGRGAELGILVKGGGPLEASSAVDTILFDKTGTLTWGKPELTDVITHGEFEEPLLLSWVAAVENASEHPVGQAIARGARLRGVEAQPVTEFISVPGFGVEGNVEGRVVRIGTSHWLAQNNTQTTALEHEADAVARRGRTPSFVSIDGRLAGMVAVADLIRDDAKQVVKALQRINIAVAMVTGDRKQTAEAVAAELGITRVFAEVRPEQKAEVIAAEQARGRRVAMVGDGINDAPALAAADVGIAIGSGTDIAVAAADIVLLRGGIGSLPIALALSRRTLRTIRENLFWAFVYNVIGIPVAAGVFYASSGWQLSPVLASAAMSLSSISVLANSLRLRRFGSKHA
jgi:Cu+-exporting ATPase